MLMFHGKIYVFVSVAKIIVMYSALPGYLLNSCLSFKKLPYPIKNTF